VSHQKQVLIIPIVNDVFVDYRREAKSRSHQASSGP